MRSADGGSGGRAMSRRTLLRAGALVAVAGPLVAACTSTPTPPPPDPLQPMLNAATKDATDAKAAAAAFADNGATLAVIAMVRQQQAAALRAEVNRAAGVVPGSAPPTTTAGATPKPKLPDESTVTAQLTKDLVTAQRQAAALLPKLPRYRTGLVGSVAAGCASLAEALDSAPITVTSATSASPAQSGGSATLSGTTSTAAAPPTAVASTAPSADNGPLASDTAAALQHALSAENAALWLYGTASAFVNASVTTEIVAAMNAVQNLRDGTEQRLTSGEITPQPAQPAYLVPSPVTDQRSALTAMAIAESDATVGWRSVLERTDDPDLRSAALAALVDSAVRQTRWRRLAGQSPASIAMPGASA
ncbi:MAG TPA: ferritin-like domain-containing protein [Pseudonocardiaceae bacterium]|nr:ferritin-like domain-containing protein [Pseudonocardiaceae bacterium]